MDTKPVKSVSFKRNKITIVTLPSFDDFFTENN